MSLDINVETPVPLLGRDSELQTLINYFAGNARIAQITGARGTGKTALALAFSRSAKAKDLFPGDICWLYAFSPQSIRNLILEKIRRPLKNKKLFIVEEFQSVSKAELAIIPLILEEHPMLSMIVVGQVPIEIPDVRMLSLHLSGLDRPTFEEIMNRILYAPENAALVTELYNRAQGNPAIAEAASFSIREGRLTLRQFLLGFRDFEYRAILGPDGKPVSKNLVVPEKVVVAVTAVNSELLERLKTDPSILRTLSSRRFEEVVAELLELQGYKVELTPASRDGGFDMYAAKNDAIGQFLYLIECKRYSPPNKVGVQIVRALHGVVQQERATAGVIATTSFFTDDAKEFQQEVKHQLQLRDYLELQKWLGIVK